MFPLVSGRHVRVPQDGLQHGVSILNTKHLMTGPEDNSEICFPRISMFPKTKSRETLRFEGNKIHCSPRDLVSLAAVFSLVTQRSSSQTAAHIRTTFLSLCGLYTNESTDIVFYVTNQSTGDCNQHRFSRIFKFCI